MSAEVPMDKNKRLVDEAVPDAMASYADFFESTYGPGALDSKTKHLVALGASLAAGCEP